MKSEKLTNELIGSNNSEQTADSLDILSQNLKNDTLAILGVLPKEPKLATNWRRLIAKIIDVTLFLLVISLISISGLFTNFSQYSESKIQTINNNCVSVENLQNIPECKDFTAKVVLLSNTIYFIGLLILTSYFVTLPQTIGKRKTKIKVISQDNTKITILQRFAREILLIIMLFLSFINLFGYNFSYLNSLILITMFFGNFRILLTKNAFHDQIAQTKVVEIG